MSSSFFNTFQLKLNGLTIDEKDNTEAGSDLDFLEEVMTLNEEINHLKNNPDLMKLKTLGELCHGMSVVSLFSSAIEVHNVIVIV